jgi:hypothetical protein
MEQITNVKYLPDGRFRPYPGFSLLFDNPGVHDRAPLGDHVWLTDRQTDVAPLPLFYTQLRASLEALSLEELEEEYLFLELPAYSYHVTVWDGLNVANRKKVHRSCQPDLADFLLDLPDSLRATSQFTALPESSPLTGPCEVTFQFDRLTVFGNSVLVALLKPADGCERACQQIEQRRIQLYEQFQREFGLSEWRRAYSPHVSLGYLGNEQRGAAASSQVSRWMETFAQAMEDGSIHLSSISLYGFLDMTTFFRRA